GGWPGIVDQLAQQALRNAEKFPVTAGMIERSELPQDIRRIAENAPPASPDAPRLIVTHNGETIAELQLAGDRLLVGRSEHNELRISSRFISRHHALFVRHGNSTFLMDLNSTNGTFVNSKRISNLMLKHEDIVLVGNHRIKFIDPAATERTPLD